MLIKKRWVGPIDRLMGHVGDIIDARAEVTRPAAMEIRDIRIDCGNVGSTDFVIDNHVRNALLNAGRAAVQEYLVQREDSTFSIPPRNQIFASGPNDIQLSRSKHEALDRTGRLITTAKLPREERFENYNAAHFRPLKAVLSNYFTVDFARSTG